MNTIALTTERLLLFACSAEHIEAFMDEPGTLSDMIGFSIPDSWPVFPEGLPWWLEELRADPAMVGWANWIFVLREEGIVIGDGGFKGKPDGSGEVEIGYAIVPEFQKRGLATEAVRTLIEWAFAFPDVNSVRAHTLVDGFESINVLKKNGMAFDSSIHDPEDGEILRWRLPREMHSSFVRSSHITQQSS